MGQDTWELCKTQKVILDWQEVGRYGYRSKEQYIAVVTNGQGTFLIDSTPVYGMGSGNATENPDQYFNQLLSRLLADGWDLVREQGDEYLFRRKYDSSRPAYTTKFSQTAIQRAPRRSFSFARIILVILAVGIVIIVGLMLNNILKPSDIRNFFQ